jgi:hypothetical protein
MRIQCKIFQGVSGDSDEEENPLEKLEREMKEFRLEYSLSMTDHNAQLGSHTVIHKQLSSYS